MTTPTKQFGSNKATPTPEELLAKVTAGALDGTIETAKVDIDDPTAPKVTQTAVGVTTVADSQGQDATLIEKGSQITEANLGLKEGESLPSASATVTGATSSTTGAKVANEMNLPKISADLDGLYSISTGSIYRKNGKRVVGIATNRGSFFPADEFTEEDFPILQDLVDRGLAYVGDSTSK